jgi:hypothetical protein
MWADRDDITDGVSYASHSNDTAGASDSLDAPVQGVR